MLGVTLFGLFFTPVFYVVIRNLVERRNARSQARPGGTVGGSSAAARKRSRRAFDPALNGIRN